MISHYWFLNHGFKFQDCISNGCCYLSMLSLNIRDIATISVKNVDYRWIIYNVSRFKAINWLQNFVL